MKFQLVLCFLLGLYAFASANSEYDVNFVAESSGYPHAGRPEVWINGAWATICAGSGWDMNDAEVFCRDLGKGYPNTITVSGGVTQSGSATKCLSRVNCYGHENSLRDCDIQPSDVIDRSADQDVGIVCYPPPSDAGIKLTNGPDQYSGLVQVKLADGSWDELHLYRYWDWSRYIPNICRQLGYGELNWWDAFELSSPTSMTGVKYCAYGVAHHRSCSYTPTSTPFQAFVGCHKPGSIPCSAPYVPNHATIDDLRVNYNFGDRVSVACDTSDARFTLQCHNKGLWSGPVVSCPEPSLDLDDRSYAYCNAPSVPPDSTIQNRRLTYDDGDYLNVTCNHAPDWFELSCDNGIWNGQNIMCPAPVIETVICSTPYIPQHATANDLRLNYNYGDRVDIICDASNARFTLQCHNKGLWSGPDVSCPKPDYPSHSYCNAPAVPPDSTIQNHRLTYEDGDILNVNCNHGPDWFQLSCDDGIWNGQNIVCPEPVIENVTCSTPYIPQHANVNDLRLNYNFGDTVNILCDASNTIFTLQCHNKGLWSGPDVSCPKPDQPSHSYCNAPAVPPDSTIQNRRLTYADGDVVNVTCNHGPDWFQLSCDIGIWNGQNIVCPEPLIENVTCSTPYIPQHATVNNLRLNYNFGDTVNIICDASNARFTLQCHNKGLWSGPDVSCPKPENVTCSTPYIPQHATVNDLRLNYNFGDTVNIICDANNARFTLQCDTKGLWSGPDVSCPKPEYPSHSYCNAPAVPPGSTIQNRRLTYADGDILNVNCNHGPDLFQLSCDDGIWNGQNIVCPALVIDAHSETYHAYCNAPSVPPDSSIQNRRLSYKDGDILNVTCNQGPNWFELRCDDGIWNGQNIVCPDPVIACNPPFIPAISSIEEIKARYKFGDGVNITCNDGSDWFVWECQSDGMWGGRKVRCSLAERPPPGEVFTPSTRIAPPNDKNTGLKLFVNGLLVTAVMLFIVVLMSMAVFVFYVRTHGFAFPRSTETALQDDKENRGPLPDLPDGYANYIGREQCLYTEPYLKHGADDYQSYETFQRPL